MGQFCLLLKPNNAKKKPRDNSKNNCDRERRVEREAGGSGVEGGQLVLIVGQAGRG